MGKIIIENKLTHQKAEFNAELNEHFKDLIEKQPVYRINKEEMQESVCLANKLLDDITDHTKRTAYQLLSVVLIHSLLYFNDCIMEICESRFSSDGIESIIDQFHQKLLEQHEKRMNDKNK